jgi:hypothetical protein
MHINFDALDAHFEKICIFSDVQTEKFRNPICYNMYYIYVKLCINIIKFKICTTELCRLLYVMLNGINLHR